MKLTTDVVVIGGGAAGMAAALSAHEQGVNVVLVDREDSVGGILNQCIHNGFGLHYFKEELTGPEYAEKFYDMLHKKDIKILTRTFVKDIDFENRVVYAVSPKGFYEIHTKALVYAGGARERAFGALMVPGDRPAGIYTAGVVQRFINVENFLPGKRALVLGSGDIGLIITRHLVLEGVEVLGVIERLPYPGGLRRNVVQCLEDFNVPLYLSSTVVEVKGKDRLEEVVVAKVDESFKPIEGTERIFKVDTLVISAGLIPLVSPLMEPLEINPTSSGVAVSNLGQTSVNWIFSAGNTTAIFDLVDYVTWEGERAGKYAGLYAKGKEFKERKRVVAGENIGVVHPAWYSPYDDLTLHIRVKKVMYEGILKIGRYERSIKHASPSEMIVVKLREKDLEGLERIEVSAVEVK